MADTYFEVMAKYQVNWLLSADALQNSAQLVWAAYQQGMKRLSEASRGKGPGPVSLPVSEHPHTTILPVAMLLAGLCLENLVKALRIQQDPSLVGPDGFKKALTTHKLPKGWSTNYFQGFSYNVLGSSPAGTPEDSSWRTSSFTNAAAPLAGPGAITPTAYVTPT